MTTDPRHVVRDWFDRHHRVIAPWSGAEAVEVVERALHRGDATATTTS